MTPERWRAARDIFEAVLDMDYEQGRLYLERCCVDVELRSEVDSLLQAYRKSEGFMESPAGMDPEGVDSLVGRQVGQYRISSEIGHGGMGEVYLAVRADSEYEKQAAIKIISYGLNTPTLLSRFRYERQILANLDHPNIARLLDGGTIDGRPYLVMEYVDGIPLDEYCARHQLSLNERLRLFQIVCKAVQFAHQNLIVHRDIKPANVLVTSEGIPKLLDFGIAKLVDASQSKPQQTTISMMTPEYASPEQIRNEPITTATDIYSLGVLLLRILTMRSPYRLSTGQTYELANAICEQEPAKPGVNGDIDNIILKALRKEPNRRYSSAWEIENDINRYLRGMPVTARRDTFGYRAAKFVLRHKIAVGVTAIVTALFVGAVVMTIVQYGIAKQERAQAQRRFDDVRHLADTFMFQIHDSIAGLPGSTLARERLVKTALEYLDKLAQESGRDRDLQKDLAAAYEKMADILHSPGAASMGGTAAAIENWSKALKLRQERAATDPADLNAKTEWADSLRGLSSVLQDNDTRRSADLARQAVDLLESVNVQRGSADSKSSLANAYYYLGSSELAAGNPDKGLEAFEKNIQLLQDILDGDPSNDRIRRNIALTNKRVGALLGMNNRLDEAFERYQNALQTEEAILAKNPLNVQRRRDLSITHSDLGWLYTKRGNTKAAIESYSKAFAIRKALADADPANQEIRFMLSSTHINIGVVLRQQKNWTDALDHFRKALALRQAIAQAEPASLRFKAEVTDVLTQIAELHFVSGKLEEARLNHEKATTIRSELVKADPANRGFKVSLALGGLRLGKTYHALASRHSTSTAAERCQMLRKARTLLHENQDLLIDLKEKGQIFDVEAKELEKAAKDHQTVTSELAYCPMVSG